MKAVLLSLVMLSSAAASAAPYALEDAGDFFPTGRRVEFADKYGWKAYHVKFEFGLESNGRSLTRDSRLTLKIAKRDGDVWEYTCKAKGRNGLTANVNEVNGKGISVVVECRVGEDDFAEVLDLDPEEVGIPNLVFHAVIQDGAIRLGAQRGLYITPKGDFAASELAAFASAEDDASSPSVIFRSN